MGLAYRGRRRSIFDDGAVVNLKHVEKMMKLEGHAYER